ncbi:MAG: sigma-54 factor interaction domain-containing protein, partial [Bacteriovoracales bacterium]
MSLGTNKDDQFVGKSDVMQKVFNIISKLAKVNTPVLIRGESGTGKELVARAIHFNGPRKDEKFVTINLAAIPETLIESELFGHEKGAFTGATERKIGKFQYANGGTLFLDEIG